MQYLCFNYLEGYKGLESFCSLLNVSLIIQFFALILDFPGLKPLSFLVALGKINLIYLLKLLQLFSNSRFPSKS